MVWKYVGVAEELMRRYYNMEICTMVLESKLECRWC
jgi:hypothetical protein